LMSGGHMRNLMLMAQEARAIAPILYKLYLTKGGQLMWFKSSDMSLQQLLTPDVKRLRHPCFGLS
jgi:hypothetical protein